MFGSAAGLWRIRALFVLSMFAQIFKSTRAARSDNWNTTIACDFKQSRIKVKVGKPKAHSSLLPE
jgi:hypothetical protein